MGNVMNLEKTIHRKDTEIQGKSLKPGFFATSNPAMALNTNAALRPLIEWFCLPRCLRVSVVN